MNTTMTGHDPNLLRKRVCGELAHAIASESGGRLFRLLARVGAWPPRTATDERRPPDGDRIGTWVRDPARPGTFVRVPQPDSLLWAAVDRIDRKTRPRVLLFGESVARGYFFDPHWNAAAVLQLLLTDWLGGDGAEVVDLARSDWGFDNVMPLVEGAMALSPDALVMFAGNNWNPWSRLSWADARTIAELLADEGGWSGVARYLESLQRTRIEQLTSRLGELAVRASMPMVVIIPEFNLLDWEDPSDPPPLPEDRLRQWLTSRRDFEQAQRAGDYATASSAAAHLLEIDGGTTAVSLRAAAMGQLRAGAAAAARRLLERARDTAMSVPVRRTPRCLTVTQDTLLESASRQQIATVDLRTRCPEACPGLPDRRLFLDYCHLSVDGVRIAMASAAELLLPALGGCAGGARGSHKRPSVNCRC